MSETLFERAAREKFRFVTPQGLMNVEDLWDIPLTSNKAGVANLEDIAQALDKKVATTETEKSFVRPNRKKRNTQAKAMLDLVVYIIETRVAEEEKAEKVQLVKAEKQKIMGIIAAKENQQLEASTVEELRKKLEELDG